MFGRVVALLALPIAAATAQVPVMVKVSASNNGSYVVRSLTDSSHAPGRTAGLIARGDMQLNAQLNGVTSIAAVDSMTVLHVDATESGRVVATAIGRYILVQRDTNGVALQARSNIPSPPLDSLRYSRRRPGSLKP